MATQRLPPPYLGTRTCALRVHLRGFRLSRFYLRADV